MTEKLVRRDGFGDVLADGTKRAAEKIGKGSEAYALHMGGQELAAHDPRVDTSLSISYRMDSTPGRHTQGGELVPPGVMPEGFDPTGLRGRAEPHKTGVSFSHFFSSMGMCMFVMLTYPRGSVLVDFLNAITGWDVDMDEALRIGERIANIRQAFSVREGLNPLEYGTPGRAFGNPPHTAGPLKGVSIDEETVDREYLVAMDWDLVTTKPSRRKLEELGMEGVARVLWP
jgi:aldehyde:ferredoxin oxidoreductase